MGIHKQIAKIIIAEHAYRPITGRILLIGRQTVHPIESEVREYLNEFGIPVRNVATERDHDTRAAQTHSITDKSFFALFSEATFGALDVTDYEQADVIHDMNEPIPDDLKGKFDFIYNGSCMDNLFNPAGFMRNCSELLAPGGRVIHVEHASLWKSAYLMYSGDWFHDYYAINDFTDCKVFYARFRFNHIQENWKLSQVTPLANPRRDRSEQCSWVQSIWPHVVICIAEKARDSTADKYPIQLHYRPETHDTLYAPAFGRWASIDRYPNAFGKATTQRPILKRLIRTLITQKHAFTRSNLKVIGDL